MKKNGKDIILHINGANYGVVDHKYFSTIIKHRLIGLLVLLDLKSIDWYNLRS